MVTPEEQLTKVGEITHNESKRLEFIAERCNALVDKKVINEDTIRELNNMFAEILSLKDVYTLRLIHILKQNHMI